MIDITYIGYNIHDIYNKYKQGVFGSHLLYGAAELEKMGCNISFYSHSKKRGLIKYFIDLNYLLKSSSKILVFPYISGVFYLILYIAIRIGYLKNKKIIGILHKTPTKSIRNILYINHIYKIFKKIYFHSPKNMEECIDKGYVKREQAECLYWGMDLNYLSQISKFQQPNFEFISTGIENRDFHVLFESFSNTSSNLDIYIFSNTNIEECPYKNIKIHKIPFELNSQSFAATLVSQSKLVVIPINDLGLTYCTGHTSMVEAMALGKPIIVTDNEYHPIDVEKEGIGIKVKPHDPISWKHAINFMTYHPDILEEMGKKGHALAKEKYNIKQCAQQLFEFIKTLT